MAHFSEVLKPINQCSMTSNESLAVSTHPMVKTFKTVNIYSGLNGSYRLVAFSLGRPVAGLLLEKTSARSWTIKSVYCITSNRRLGFSKGLLTIARLMLPNVKHSEHLTSVGKLWAYSVEGLAV